MPLNSTDLFSDSWKGVPSYGIQLSESDGGTSGRFAVAEIIARVFPAHWSFVRQVTGEGIEPASSFPYGPYPTDKLIYKDKETVEYVTPPNTEGLGTQSYLAKDGDPINGVAILTGKDPDLTKLAARLPPEMSDLLPVVIRQVEQDSSQPAAEPAQSDTMQPFTSTEGRFSVLFPGAPRQASQPVHWKNGETGTIHDFIATADNGKTGYVVGYTDSAPDVVAEGAQAHLQRTENGFIAGKTLLSDKVIDLDGVSGRAFTAADSRSNYIVREFVAGTRFYRLTVITPKGYTATQADQFTDSFRILDMPDQVGQCRITSVKKIDTRLEGTPGSGSAIEFINGGYQVSYDTVPAIEKSLPGDQVKFCLVSIPANCPAGDARGREYKTENLRTGESWTLPDSEHECGGA